MTSRVYGVGVNDSNYRLRITKQVNGKTIQVWICPYYRRWKTMLMRCYSTEFTVNNPTYEGCYVCDDWLYFMTFRAWMVEQEWEDRDLDKDLAVKGSKVYSPETCAFITKATNRLLTDCKSSRGDYPIGVSYHKRTKRYHSRVSYTSPTTGERVSLHLGYFDDPMEAHQKWKDSKVRIILEYAGLQEDSRIVSSLERRAEEIQKTGEREYEYT